MQKGGLQAFRCFSQTLAESQNRNQNLNQKRNQVQGQEQAGDQKLEERADKSKNKRHQQLVGAANKCKNAKEDDFDQQTP